MIYGLYSIRDIKSTFMQVLTDHNDSTAMRGFKQACTVADSIMAMHPTDFALYRVGSFNVDTGEIISQPPELLCDAAQFVREEFAKDEVCYAV